MAVNRHSIMGIALALTLATTVEAGPDSTAASSAPLFALVPPTDVTEPPPNCADISGSAPEQLAAARTWNAATLSQLNRTLRRDVGDLRAHAQRLAYLAIRSPRSSAAVDSAEWLVVACPNLPLLAMPEVARVDGADFEEVWNRARRRSATTATHGNYWSYIAATRPLDMRPRPTDPKLSPAQRRERIAALAASSPASPDYPAVAMRAFEAWRAEIRDQRRRAPVRRPFSPAAGVDPLDHAVPYLEAAAAAYAAGFQDTAERLAGEFLALWARAGRPASPHLRRALELMSNSAHNRGDQSLATSLRDAAGRNAPAGL